MGSVLPVRRSGRTHRLRYLALGALLLSLGACSAVKLAYDHADLYLRLKAGDYFSPEGEQKFALNERLDAIASWHRREELPRYATLLLAARDRVGGGLTDADLEWFMDSAKTRYETLVRQAVPDVAELAGSLSPTQIARFETRLKHENDRFAEEYVSPSEQAQRQRRYETTLDRIQDWTGPLSEVQRVRLKDLSFAMPLSDALRHADRQRRQRVLLSILRRNLTQAERAAALEAWLIEWDQGRTREYEQAAFEARRQTIAMMLDLDRSLTASQRSRVQGNLARYAADFSALSMVRPRGAAGAVPSLPPMASAIAD